MNSARQGVMFTPESACLPSTPLPASWSGSMPVSLSLNAGWCMQHICVSSHEDSSYQHVTGVSPQLCTVAGYKAEHSLTVHSGGLEALDARGNFVATCGYGTRLGQVALDNMVKVLCRPPLLLKDAALPASLGVSPAPLEIQRTNHSSPCCAAPTTCGFFISVSVGQSACCSSCCRLLLCRTLQLPSYCRYALPCV